MVCMPLSEIFSVVPGRQGQITNWCLDLNQCVFVMNVLCVHSCGYWAFACVACIFLKQSGH